MCFLLPHIQYVIAITTISSYKHRTLLILLKPASSVTLTCLEAWQSARTTHLSPALRLPSVCLHWALLEEAGKPLIGRLGERTHHRRGERTKRGGRVWGEGWGWEYVKRNVVGQSNQDYHGKGKKIKSCNALRVENVFNATCRSSCTSVWAFVLPVPATTASS